MTALIIDPEVAELELHAYVDGELPAERVADVEGRLIVDPDARVLVKALNVQRDALRAQFGLSAPCLTSKAMVALVMALPTAGSLQPGGDEP